MNAFHLFIKFTLLTCLSIGMLAITNHRVDDVQSVDNSSNGQNHEPSFSLINHNWLAASQNYFPSHDYLFSAPNGLTTNSGLDQLASEWGVYTDGEGNPIWEISNVSDPSLDGRSLRCAITGGNPNSNVHCYRNLLAEPTRNFFTLSLSFYYQPASSFNNVGEPSIVQGLEFTMNKWDQGLRYEWALQWKNVDSGGGDTGAPEWRYWDPAHSSSRWVDLGISDQITNKVSSNVWHELILEGEILEGKVHYRRFVLDGYKYQLNNIPLVAATLEPSEPNKLAVAVQLDGNSTETPYELFIDHVTLASSDSIGATISNITRANPNPSDETNLNYAVTFSAPVTGVDTADFALITTGVSGPTMSGVSGSGNAYTVTVNTGSGSGTIRLDVTDNDTILNGLGNPLGGAGTGNGNFSGGETYTITKSWIFGDVPASYWANSFIERLYNAGITGGCSTSPLMYCPFNPVTRAQMAIFILRGIHGSIYTPPTATGTVFKDVSINSFGAAWIEQFALERVTSGCSNGMYCPDANVTRAQMAIFLLKGKHGSSYVPPVANGIFLDVPVGSFAADWIEQLAAEGITSGCSNGNYCPDANVTRDQMAVFLVRAFNLP